MEVHIEALATISGWTHSAERIEQLVGATSEEEATAYLLGLLRRETDTARIEGLQRYEEASVIDMESRCGSRGPAWRQRLFSGTLPR
jgi:hypothetical protein